MPEDCPECQEAFEALREWLKEWDDEAEERPQGQGVQGLQGGA